MSNMKNKGLDVSVRSFVTAIVVIFCLMVTAYVLTMLIPGGAYDRIVDENGHSIIDTTSEFRYIPGGISFWNWLASPILVLGAEGNGTLIAVILFLLVIGGIFTALERCGLMEYMLNRISIRFAAVRYRMLAVTMFLFMAMGAMIGSFEECVPMVPIVVALSQSFGWDAMTGLAMSLLAAGCGFASGVCNPFTVGIAQQLAGLPIFSGVWLRMLSFAAIYLLLLLFVTKYAMQIERPVAVANVGYLFEPNRTMDQALIWFAGLMGLGITLVLCSGFITALQDYTMVIVAVTFLVAGVVAIRMASVPAKTMMKNIVVGIGSILPAVLMILMASSIRYILEQARILDTILHYSMDLVHTMPDTLVILFIYLVVLVMNFFIPSGSAKAFMLIPLIVPMAGMFGLSSQLCVLAFAFGDGFSNVFYPTNPALLIALGLANVNYGDWFKWSVKFQILNLALTSGILLLGLAVGY